MSTDPALTAQADQAIESSKALADITGAYFNRLLDRKLQRAEALELTQTFIEVKFGDEEEDD